MATITLQADAPGKGRLVNTLFNASRTVQMAVYDFAFDSSYPTGGEDISSIWNDFSGGILGIWVSQNEATVADVRLIQVDMTNKKLKLIKTLASGANVEDTNASDQSAVGSVRLLVVGYK